MIRKTFRSIFSAPLILLVRFYQVCISPLTPPLHSDLLAVRP